MYFILSWLIILDSVVNVFQQDSPKKPFKGDAPLAQPEQDISLADYGVPKVTTQIKFTSLNEQMTSVQGIARNS